MKKFLLIFLLILFAVPITAQETVDTPSIVIPSADVTSQSISVERVESAGYMVFIGVDGTFQLWIGRDGYTVFWNYVDASNGAIYLPENNVWLMNGDYTLWLCQTSCEAASSWVGPAHFSVNESQPGPVANLSNRVKFGPGSGKLSYDALWQTSHLISWYWVQVSISPDHQNAGQMLLNEWYPAKSICTLTNCRIPVIYGIDSSIKRNILVSVNGWGAGGFSTQTSTSWIQIYGTGPGDCPPNNIAAPDSTCIIPPGPIG